MRKTHCKMNKCLTVTPYPNVLEEEKLKRIEISLQNTLLYTVLYYVKDGLRGEIEVHLYDSLHKLKEKNTWGDFYLTETGELHINRTYQYKEHAGYILAFVELQRMLYKIGIEEDVLLEANTSLTNLLIHELAVPDITVEVHKLTNMENLAYLFEHMMRYNCSPALTSDFLEKLDYSEATIDSNEYEALAVRLRDEIEVILNNTEHTESMKQEFLEEFIVNNIQIFADYDRAQQEDGQNGTTFTR